MTTSNKLTKLAIVLEDLESVLTGLMFKYNYHPSVNAFACQFCDAAYDRDVAKTLVHAEDCLGVRLTETLREVNHD